MPEPNSKTISREQLLDGLKWSNKYATFELPIAEFFEHPKKQMSVLHVWYESTLEFRQTVFDGTQTMMEMIGPTIQRHIKEGLAKLGTTAQVAVCYWKDRLIHTFSVALHDGEQPIHLDEHSSVALEPDSDYATLEINGRKVRVKLPEDVVAYRSKK